MGTGGRDDRPPWSLSRLPNYDRAREVLTVDASELTERDFRRLFVDTNTPVRIRSAVGHWPACARWSDGARLRAACDTKAPVVVQRQPLIQPFTFGTASRRRKMARLYRECARTYRERMNFGRFLDAATGASAGYYGMKSVAMKEGGLLGPVRGDLGGLSFLQPKSTYHPIYALWGVFLFRETYTDWHYHPASEALLCQVVGSKEIALLSPDWQTWRAMFPLVDEECRYFDVDLAKYPAFAQLVPHRAEVGAGDALYIPNYWWHAVEASSGGFGATATAWFDSPLPRRFGLEYPAALFVWRQALAEMPKRDVVRHVPAAAFGYGASVARWIRSSVLGATP